MYLSFAYLPCMVQKKMNLDEVDQPGRAANLAR